MKCLNHSHVIHAPQAIVWRVVEEELPNCEWTDAFFRAPVLKRVGIAVSENQFRNLIE
jgi:hypothetical protein